MSMPIRTIPVNLSEQHELPETIDINEVAKRLGLHVDTVP
jgi:hypothetical protein